AILVFLAGVVEVEVEREPLQAPEPAGSGRSTGYRYGADPLVSGREAHVVEEGRAVVLHDVGDVAAVYGDAPGGDDDRLDSRPDSSVGDRPVHEDSLGRAPGDEGRRVAQRQMVAVL